MESDVISADAIEATEFPDLAERYEVSSVPTTVVNGTPAIRGMLAEGAFLEQILQSLPSPRKSNAMAARDR
jgi:predicted DsbA family dithiol-disulfide isomerase